MKPTNGKCVIRPEFNEGRLSPGGIWLDKQAYRGLPNRGIVVAMPDGEHEFGVGDNVMYQPHKSDIEAIPKRVFGFVVALTPVDSVMAILPRV